MDLNYGMLHSWVENWDALAGLWNLLSSMFISCNERDKHAMMVCEGLLELKSRC
jgi:hypothetical protein